MKSKKRRRREWISIHTNTNTPGRIPSNGLVSQLQFITNIHYANSQMASRSRTVQVAGVRVQVCKMPIEAAIILVNGTGARTSCHRKHDERAADTKEIATNKFQSNKNNEENAEFELKIKLKRQNGEAVHGGGGVTITLCGARCLPYLLVFWLLLLTRVLWIWGYCGRTYWLFLIFCSWRTK